MKDIDTAIKKNSRASILGVLSITAEPWVGLAWAKLGQFTLYTPKAIENHHV